jgi:hypothetical protein
MSPTEGKGRFVDADEPGGRRIESAKAYAE